MIRSRVGVAYLLLLITLAGCSGPQNASKPLEESSIKPLAMYYGRSRSQNMGQPPADEQAFRKYLATMSAEDLKKDFNVGSIDELFISKRDNQPYVIMYGTNNNPPTGPGSQPVVAYEKTGVGGKRYVATELGGVEEVDEARFKQLVPGGT
jgi:hypothetical protein